MKIKAEDIAKAISMLPEPHTQLEPIAYIELMSAPEIHEDGQPMQTHKIKLKFEKGIAGKGWNWIVHDFTIATS